MSDLGSMIDDMWNEAGQTESNSPGCTIIGCIIFFGILAIMIYFMK